jgi:acyl-CoA thioester hydrolase
MTAAPGHAVPVRWQDLDANGHANHVVFLTYLEEGRDAWLRSHGIGRDEYVVGRCTVHFRREIGSEIPTVHVRCAVADLGRSSITTREQLFDPDGNVLADAEFVLVHWDPRERCSRPLSDQQRASLATTKEALR